jgi:LPPG:FO 2-phospho-L-lactate transferase
MITVLCGGVGGSRFLRAVTSVIDGDRVTAIVNTGDDEWFHGLYVSPDPDIVTYALAGEVDEERGWGLRGDTFRWLESLRRFGHETWFQIGDRDLATHLHRTRLSREGVLLSEIAADIARAFGVRVRILPMSDDRVRTVVETDAGDLPFQEYLVKRHAVDAVRGVRFEGADVARPAPGVLEAISNAEALFIAPSNPVGSIGPILALPGVRKALESRGGQRVAISPIIGGRSLQPPAAEMIVGLGLPVDPTGVARLYSGIIDTLIIDETDEQYVGAVNESGGATAILAQTIMRDDASRRALAVTALRAAGITS